MFNLPGTEKFWLVGNDGLISYSTNGGRQWHIVSTPALPFPQASGANNIAINQQTENRLADKLAKKAGVRVLRNKTKLLFDPVTEDYRTVFFLDDQHGWAGGNSGAIIATQDGGRSWQQQASDNTQAIKAIHFVDAGYGELHGWAVGNKGTILATTDGGRRWWPQPSGTRQDLSAVQFVDSQRGWAIGHSGTILLTRNGGAHWQANVVAGIISDLNALYFIDADRGWIVGNSGIILTTDDGAEHWQPQVSDTQGWLASVQFVRERDGSLRGWVADHEGNVLNTFDGGESWTLQPSGSHEVSYTLLLVRSTSNQLHGWAVGYNGEFLTTQDSGQHWNLLVYQKELAPWYFLSWLLVLVLLAPVLRRPKPVELTQRSIANVAISDRPLRSGDPDPLHFQAIAQGLSRFLRNDSSEPPVTIAVTGKWGSGKSSLMNLLRADLKRYGTRAVWFNAWHHQRQSQLLAALLDAIRKQAIPSWFAPAGWNFRLRLLLRRAQRRKFLAFFVLVMFSTTVAYFSSGSNFADARQELRKIWSAKSVVLSGNSVQKIKKKFEWQGLASAKGEAQPDKQTEGSKDWLDLAPLLRSQQGKIYDSKDALYTALVVASLTMSEQTQAVLDKYKYDILLYTEQAGIVGKLLNDEQDVSHDLTGLLGRVFGPLFTLLILVMTVWRSIGAFGLNPSVLLKSINGKNSPRQLRVQTGFRQQFAREFEDVTQALKPYQMVIIIDDLDRCNPDAVLEVLEAVNFLVASGECYIVLGMDMDVVRSCVGLSYEKLAEEMVSELSEPVTDPKLKAKESRREFARHYLEKLVNIEVPVPMPDNEQSRQLIAPQAGKAVAMTLRQQLGLAIPRLVPHAKLLGFMLLAITLGVAGYRYYIQPAERAIEAQQQQASTTLAAGPTSDPQDAAAMIDGTTLQSVRKLTRARATSGQTANYPHHQWYLIILLLLLVGLWMLLRRADVVVRDSNDFKLALNIWHKVIAAYCHTPRSMKRFINRVRYLAMLQSQSDVVQTLSHRARLLWNRVWNIGVSGLPFVAQRIPEPMLVALSAIQLGQAKRLHDGNKVFDELVSQSASGLAREMRELFQQALTKHMQTFATLPADNLAHSMPQPDQHRSEAEADVGQNGDLDLWPPSEEQVRVFLRCSEGVRVA